MKSKIIVISTLIVLLTTLILSYLFLIKPSKTLNFNNDLLVSIELTYKDKNMKIKDEDFNKFLEDLNTLKYKEKNKGVKTKGEYFITINYENDVYEIGRYYSTFNEKSKYTLFKSNFDEFVKSWLNSN